MTFQQTLFKSCKIKTNKYLNNDITKLVLAVVTILHRIKEMKALEKRSTSCLQ